MNLDNNKNEIAKYIGNKIYELRKSKKMTREELAEKTELSPNYIYEIEKGNSIPGCAALINICNYFKVTPYYFFEKYLDIDIGISSELTNSSFNKLSNYDKKLVLDFIDFLANREK